MVPNNYLQADILLGCDKKLFHWRKTPYAFHLIRSRKNAVRNVTQLPPPVVSLKPENRLHDPHQIQLDPYQTKFILLPVEAKSGTILIVHPKGKPTSNCHPFCVQVSAEQTIPCPVTNLAKVTKIFKLGILFGWYEKGEVNSPSIYHIQNYLLLHSDQLSIPGGR